MEAEGVQLDITDGAKKMIAKLATQINREVTLPLNLKPYTLTSHLSPEP